MSFNGLRLEYDLEGSSNFIAWKDQMAAILDDNGVLKYVKNYIAKHPQSNTQKLTQWKKDVSKTRRIILEGVRDHVVSNLHGKQTPFSMWKTLIELLKITMTIEIWL